jgi:hypothetical protein
MKQNREIFCCNEAKFKFQVKIDTCHACKQEAENFGASEGFLALSFQISGIALQLQTVARKSFLCRAPPISARTSEPTLQSPRSIIHITNSQLHRIFRATSRSSL